MFSQMFSSAKSLLTTAGMAILILLGVYIKGRWDGTRGAAQRSQTDLLEDINTHKEIANEVTALSHDALSKRLHKWTRK